MIELVAAMAVLAVGVLALFVMFESGMLQIRRAAAVSTAAALADSEMERFRAVEYATIGLDEADVAAADATYKGDTAWKANASERVHVAKCGTSPCTTSVPVKTATGADGDSYRVDTYVTWQTVQNQAGTPGRNVKLVTLVVRDPADTSKVLARISSAFDESTGV
jgi:Tfp pilus assembly protein PilV